MNATAKALWIQELDNYTQGTEVLRTADDTYCCLGVLCQAYHEATGLGEWVQTPQGHYMFKTETDYNIFLLPVEVRDWAGLATSAPELLYNGEYEGISVLNDGNSRIDGLPFSEIKELIREQL
jgi:hypothetical protein